MMLSGKCWGFGLAGKMNLWIQSLHVILSRICGLLSREVRAGAWTYESLVEIGKVVCDTSRAEKPEVVAIT